MEPTWKFFVLGREKTPLPNCLACANADASHDREACSCLTCHGFYAGTSDEGRLTAMMRLHPDGHMAVRTGQASGIIVIDAEGRGEPSGVDVLDGWESWSGGWSLAHTELVASTPSGGVHRYYRWVPGVRSRNRILPGIDIKSDGGYVVIPPDEGRSWLLSGAPSTPDDNLVGWLRSARGRHSGESAGVVGHSDGYDYERYVRDGCPDGVRDEFFNELIFRLRKAGVDRSDIVLTVRNHWKRTAQPPAATYYMPWHHVEYKIARIWRTVEPDDVIDELREWAARVNAPVAQRGRVSLVPRG